MTAPPNPRSVRVLEEDPELAGLLAPEERTAAERQLVAPMIALVPGDWNDAEAVAGEGCLGVLVLSGVIVRNIGRSGRLGAEILGTGDLMRPWQDGDAGSLDFGTSWTVVSPTQIAVLDQSFGQRACGFPELMAGLLARSTQRARSLAVTMAIAQEPTVEARLELLLWHLADRYGRVRTNGVIVPIMLTHSILARLVAARRPSTTTALGKLAQRGLVERHVDGWLLTGDPPSHRPGGLGRGG
ncbi:MAG TPA: Crp/Fnr family transcriptional regulator [Solirubrobacteraceae bacterium]